MVRERDLDGGLDKIAAPSDKVIFGLSLGVAAMSAESGGKH